MRILHDMKPIEGPFLTVEEAEYIDGYRLRLTFNDGTNRVVDFGNYLRDAPRPWSTKYWNLKEFKKFRLLDGDLMWGDFDLVFPIADLYNGKIEYGFPERFDSPIPVDFKKDETPESETLSLPATMLRRLEARAKKEAIPLELLVERYIEESIGRHG